MQPNLDQVIEILKKEGLSDDKISQFVESLTKALSEHLYLTIVEQLEETEMAQLNQITDEVQREAQMRQVFEQKTGQNLQSISDQFVQSFMSDFLTGYNQTTSASPVS